MKININKKYRYRSGKPARIVCVDAPGAYPVISIDENGDPSTHQENGRYYTDKDDEGSIYDLIEVREPRKVWVNEYPNDSFATWPTRESADMNATVERIACHEIELPPIP